MSEPRPTEARPSSDRMHGDAPRRLRSEREGGQTLVLFTLFFAVILGFAALVLDQGVLRKANVDLYNALDAGALAGVSLLPDDWSGAEATAREYVQLNYPGTIPDSDVRASFRCLIGSAAGVPRLTDIPDACDPGLTLPTDWSCDSERCVTTCEPALGETCNVIVMEGPANVDYLLAPVLDVLSGTTNDRLSAACKGLCGEPPEVPLDLIMILDRTGSMRGIDTTNARTAAHSVRTMLDPSIQWLGFGALGPSRLGQLCKTQADTVIGTAAPGDLRRWMPIGLTGAGAGFGLDYLSATSLMALSIDCFGNSSTRTDIADPVRMATTELQQSGRGNAVQAILLLSDGQPNISTTGTSNFCQEADSAATVAKAQGIEVFTVGFGLDGANDIPCIDASGAWTTRTATDLLASMATNSANDNGCPGTENDDGDHYFCLPKTAGASTDLSDVFQRAVATLTGHSRLVKLP